MTAKNQQNPSQGAYRVPVALRVGGAFMALAIVLIVFTVVSVFLDGWMAPFVVTPSFLVILLAAVILGAFATVRKDQAASRSQVIALIVAVALVILSSFLSTTALYVMAQYWLPMYAVLAFLCALVIRRSLIPKN